MNRTVVIVDDHLLIAEALGSFIKKFEHYTVLYECANGRELQQKFKKRSNIPDIVLLDVSMPVMNGVETAAWLKAWHPQVIIMALSMQDDEESLLSMIRNGARGYLLKNVTPTVLEDALEVVLQKQYYLPGWAVQKVMGTINETKEPISAEMLSEKEKEFLAFCTTEMNYKEIAEKMRCSPRTIDGYRDHLFEKLAVKTRVGLAVYAMRNGIGN